MHAAISYYFAQIVDLIINRAETFMHNSVNVWGYTEILPHN